ncbi:hypothetical protein LAZ67_1004638 [Cordylochernes scorpioides]|uniref:ATP-dependent DNA helicase n=1 Tax=Cordylochernes scorpioides TaxID=51811 RepID=A0ABY6JXS2_9ARAC|nr:hypothetical protein LAZ67_1004638 [Cordylochernes scorpioides]
MQNEKPLGGKTIIFGGDFRQTLPVVPHGTQAAILDSSIKFHPLWKKFNILKLDNNIRSIDPEFSAWLLKLGNGELTNDLGLDSDTFEIPSEMVCNGDLVKEIYGDKLLPSDFEQYTDKAILCPRNVDVDDINNRVLDILEGDSITYFSSDSIDDATPEDNESYPPLHVCMVILSSFIKTQWEHFLHIYKKLSDSNLWITKGTCAWQSESYVKARLSHGSRSLPILVASGLGPNILGRQWFAAFRLKLNFLNSLETNPISPDFEELFKEEIDVYNGPLIHIDIPDNAEPKFVKARTVPFALRNLVDEKLKVLEEQGVIEPVKFTKWASPIVTVLKNDGSIRICHDYKSTVNLYSNPDKYPLPTIPQLLDKLRQIVY